MASVKHSEAAGNHQTTAAVTTTTSSTVDPQAVVWGVLAKSAEKSFNRDALADGSAHSVKLVVRGEVDGHQIKPIELRAIMTVGHDSERASSQTPNPAGLAAYLLSKMNEQTRAAVLRDLPAQFIAGDCEYPAVDAEVGKACDNLLKQLRAAKRSTVRGSVSVKHLTN